MSPSPFDIRSGANPGVDLGSWTVDGQIRLPAGSTVVTTESGTVVTIGEAADALTGTIVGSASSATDSSAVTTETVVLTTTICTLRSGRAYAAKWGPNISTSNASGEALLKLRKGVAGGGVTGTQLGATAVTGSATAGAYKAASGAFLIANSTRYPIHIPLVLTLDNATASTATMVATATATPRYLYVQDIGPVADWAAYCTAVTDPFSEDVYANGVPVAYWTLGDLDQGLVDTTAHGHDLTLYGGVTASDFVDTGGALAFNGLTGYLEAPDSPAFSVPTTGVVAYELWMRPDAQDWPSTSTQSADTDQYTHWFGKGNVASGGNPSSHEYIFRYYNASAPTRPQRISTYAFNLSGGLGAGSYVQEPVANGEWDYYVGILNSDDTSLSPYGTVKLYKNGALRDSDGMGAPYYVVPADGSAPLRIGTQSKLSFADAGLARVVFWDRAPSAAELIARYRTVVPLAEGTAAYVRTTATGVETTSATTLVLTVDQTFGVGNQAVICIYGTYTAGAVVVTDSKANVWTSKRTGASTGNVTRLSTFTCSMVANLVAADTVTITWSGANTFRSAILVECSSVTTTADVANGRVGNNATPHIETTTLNADDLIVAAIGFEYNNTLNASPYDPGAWQTAGYIGTTDPTVPTNGRGLIVGIRSVPTAAEYDYEVGLGTLDGGAQAANWIGQTVPLEAV